MRPTLHYLFYTLDNALPLKHNNMHEQVKQRTPRTGNRGIDRGKQHSLYVPHDGCLQGCRPEADSGYGMGLRSASQ